MVLTAPSSKLILYYNIKNCFISVSKTYSFKNYHLKSHSYYIAHKIIKATFLAIKTSVVTYHIWQFSTMSNIQREDSQVHFLSTENRLSAVKKSTRIDYENRSVVTTKFIWHLVSHGDLFMSASEMESVEQ